MSRICKEKQFIWVTNNGEELYPSEMETSHLFFSLRMIWNHTAPKFLRFEPYKRWRLNFTSEYKKEAVRAFLKELATRELTQDQKDCLTKMRKWMIVFDASNKFLKTS